VRVPLGEHPRPGRRRFLGSLAVVSGLSIIAGLSSLAGRPQAASIHPLMPAGRMISPTLRRGVALSSWFANAPRQPLLERDFVQIRQLGSHHVRLQVNPELPGLRSPEGACGPRPDPAKADWPAVQRLVSAVRESDKRRLLLVSGPLSGGIKGLCPLTPLEDSNVAYTFHYYSPFRHYPPGNGFRIEGTAISFFRSLPYPSALANAAVDYAPGAPRSRKSSAEFLQYQAANWSAVRITEEIGDKAEWAAKHRVRVLCTEFGAYRPFIDPASRYRWIGGVRRVLERYGIGWTIYDYADVFGITTPIGETRFEKGDRSVVLVDPTRGHRRIDPEAIAALELRQL
jgi:hypothetical protein